MPTLNTFPANPSVGNTYTIDSGVVYVCSSADPDIWNIQGTNATVLGTDQVTTDKIKDLAVTNDKLLGSISEAKIVSLPTTKLTGTVADSQIAAVATTKLTGTVTNAQLASGISSAKLTGALPAIDGSALTGVAGGYGKVLTLDGLTATTAPTGTFVPSGNTIVVTGCGSGGLGGSNNANPGNQSKGGGGGGGAGVLQAVMNVTAGATYTVSCANEYTQTIVTNGLTIYQGTDSTITLNGGSTILTIGGGSSGTRDAAGSGGTITATEGTTTGTMVAGSVIIDGIGGNGKADGNQMGAGRAAPGPFGSRDTYTTSSTDDGVAFFGNQRGRGTDGRTGGGAGVGRGGFITILY